MKLLRPDLLGPVPGRRCVADTPLRFVGVGKLEERSVEVERRVVVRFQDGHRTLKRLYCVVRSPSLQVGTSERP